MQSSQAIEIIIRERQLIEEWVNQDGLLDTEGLIIDREITQSSRALREAARYAPLNDATMVEKIVELAETRLNSGR